MFLPETAVDASAQLFNLTEDPGETTNLFFIEAEKREELVQLLQQLKSSGRSAPLNREPLGVDKVKELSRSLGKEN